MVLYAKFKPLISCILQVILQLAESGSFLGQVDLFKVRGKFALTDAYESHFILPKGKVLMITHRRVILLQVSLAIPYRSLYMHKVYFVWCSSSVCIKENLLEHLQTFDFL